MSRLRTYAPMKRISNKKRATRQYRAATAGVDVLVGAQVIGNDPVYIVVGLRSEGRCEVTIDGARCPKRQQDHHHTVKPRESHHAPEYVMAICRAHHARVDWPYKRGRLLTVPNGDGTFRCAIVTAPDKFTYRRETT